MHKPTVLILHAPGTNRDQDAAHAIWLAGGEPRILHLNQLQQERDAFHSAQVLVIPGGFSYGDALGAGQRWALDLQLFFHDELQAFVDSGKRVLGICNGFQVLVKAGLLPAVHDDSGARAVTLTHNESGHFECRWVHLSVNRACRADYLSALDDLLLCPVAHGEGNLQVRDEATLARLEQDGLVAFRYVNPSGSPANGLYPLNPNGSVADIAGLCNATGNVLGLMPHPEDHVSPFQNPFGQERQLGLALFRAIIQQN